MSMDMDTPGGMREEGRRPRESSTPLPGAILVPIQLIQRDPDQVRRDWRADGGHQRLDELTRSVREFGILQPLVVREDGDHYIVIAGGRRLVAAQRAGLTQVPVVVRNDDNITRVRVMQLVENLQRHNLTATDEARAFQELIDLEGMTPPQIALRVHVSEQYVRDRLRILRDQTLADAVERRQIAVSVAREINKLADEAANLLRRRVEAGEKIQMADIKETRRQLAEAGIVNPRLSPRADRSTPGAPTAGAARVSPQEKGREVSPPALHSKGEPPPWPASSAYDPSKGAVEGAMRKIMADYALYRSTSLSEPAAPAQTGSSAAPRAKSSLRPPTASAPLRRGTHDEVGEGLPDLLAGLDRARLERVLLFALDQGWTVAGLLQQIRAGAKG